MTKSKKKPVEQPVAKKQLKSNTAFSNKYVFFSVFVTFLVFIHAALNNGFTNWDDGKYVTQNAVIKTWDFAGLFTTRVVSNWAPAHQFLLMLEYHLFGLAPAGYHITSLLLHLCNVILTFLIVFKLTNKQVPAFIAALFFGIHPMHVSSVAWVSDQKDLLSFFFYMFSVLMYLKYKEHRGTVGTIHELSLPKLSLRKWFKNKCLAGALIFFILSCLAKATGVTLPVVLVLIDCYRENNWHPRFITRSLIGKIPFLILSIALGLTAWYTQKTGGVLDMMNLTYVQEIGFACYGLFTYLARFIVPFSLPAFHSYPVKNASGMYPFIYLLSPVAIIVLIIIGVMVLILRVRKHQSNNTLLFGLGFFLANIILLLKLKAVGRAILAERYSYLSYFGLLFIAGSWLNNLWEKYRNQSKALMLTGYYLLAAAFAFYSFSYADVWRNSVTLWSHIIDSFPEGKNMDYAPDAYSSRADAYINLGEYDLGINDCNKAISLKPDYVLAYNNRADVYINQGKFDLAIADCSKIIALKPDFVLAYFNRGNAYNRKHEFDSAVADYNKAIILKPDFFALYSSMAFVYVNKGKYDSAIVYSNKALALKLDCTDAYFTRGAAYAGYGKTDLAMADWNTAININPNYVNAYINLAKTYKQMGDKTQAEIDFSKARRLGWKGE